MQLHMKSIYEKRIESMSWLKIKAHKIAAWEIFLRRANELRHHAKQRKHQLQALALGCHVKSQFLGNQSAMKAKKCIYDYGTEKKTIRPFCSCSKINKKIFSILCH